MSTIAVPLTVPELPVRLGRLLLSLMAGIALWDVCFWNANGQPGLSVAVFVLVLALLVALNRWERKTTRLGVVLSFLVAGAAWAAVIETGFTNVVTCLVLVTLLAGECHFSHVGSAWGRCLTQLFGLMRAPFRLFWLAARMLEAGVRRMPVGMQGIGYGLFWAIPIGLVTVIFGELLASGNPVFGLWTGTFFEQLWQHLLEYLNPARLAFWGFGVFCLLPLLRPAMTQERWWRWCLTLPRFSEGAAQATKPWPSLIIMGVLNVLFLVANFADSLFLWSGQKLPDGVNYSQFVHQGTNALTVAVLFSAVILTAIFQQSLTIASRRELKVLAYVWIGQNLFLLLSVGLRLKLYIEAYDMTVARLSVILFLILVAAGYGLLIVKIQAEKSLSWLIGGAAIAVAVLFYVVQFMDLAGWSARYNVAQWEKSGHVRALDVDYLRRLGPAAWPALRRAYDEDRATVGILGDEELLERTTLDQKHWREFSLRAWLNSGALK